MISIKSIGDTSPYLDSLCQLLTNCVDAGASIGFLPPLQQEEASKYWLGLNDDLAANERVMYIALQDDTVLGTIQLSLPQKPNAQHRAEVEKLMVHTDARGKGIAKQLMAAMEQAAADHQRRLLVLDTRFGDVASDLYRKLNYIEAGQIPNFALNGEGGADATVYFYKELS